MTGKRFIIYMLFDEQDGSEENTSFYNFNWLYNPVSNLESFFLQGMQKFTHMGRENKKLDNKNQAPIGAKL